MTRVFQQGEVRIIKRAALPADVQTEAVKAGPNGYIISHSESGHHHVLTGGDVLERTSGVPAGMQVFYAILDEPQALIQDAPDAHEQQELDAGVWEFRISREHDPFAEQARRVAD